MKPGIPWSVKGIEPEVREVAKHAARRSGMTLGEWLNTVILDQAETPEQAPAPAAKDPMTPAQIAAPHRSETTIRLEDIAQQLSRLAQREQEAAAIRAYEPPPARQADEEAINRILARIESNERQQVEAFSAVNDRLSNLGRQLAATPAAPAFEKPEDVPGFQALEAAVRNIVDHIEISERRTRDSLKSMQDRMGDMASRAAMANSDELVRAAPAFASLEARLNDLAGRVLRNEQAAERDDLRGELANLGHRIDGVQRHAEQMAATAHANATHAAQRELRDIETRIQTLLHETQATMEGHAAGVADLQRVKSEVEGLTQRIEQVREAAASEHDMNALRVAVEQLSSRLAQGADLRPLADMDRRLADLTHRLEQTQHSARHNPQLGELENRIAELDHRLAEVLRVQHDGKAVAALEQQLGDVGDRIARTEQQLGHLDTIERAITQLFDGLEQHRTHTSRALEETARRATNLAAPPPLGDTAEIRALQQGLQAVRDSAEQSDRRSQETLEAVHETLEQIVSKLAELETSAAGHQVAARLAQQAAAPAAAAAWAAEPLPAVAPQDFVAPPFEPATPAPAPSPAPQPTPFDAASAVPGLALPHDPALPPLAAAPEPELAPGADSLAGDDFIAAARRAAQAAAGRATPVTERPPIKAGANSRLGQVLTFLKPSKTKKKKSEAAAPTGTVRTVPILDAPRSGDATRRKLILAGIVLLAAVSALTFNMLGRTVAPAPEAPAVEQNGPVQEAPPAAAPAAPAPGQSSRLDLPQQAQDIASLIGDTADVTGSLGAAKTDASLASLIVEPGTASSKVEMPPPESGPEALRRAAANGDAKAQFVIASRYLDGEGLTQDVTKAAYWYQEAASRGLAPAQYRVATLFERGRGVPKDVATAMVWYERAAGNGNVKSMHNAAVLAAGNELGMPDYDKAFRLFKEAAEHGLKDSQFNLAVLYERGLGSKIDSAEALFWYLTAAQASDADAGSRAETLAKSLPADVVATIRKRAADWQPMPDKEDANAVAVTEPSWQGPGGGSNVTVTPAPAPAAAPQAEPQSLNPVKAVQELLMKLGFNVGDADGRMGTRTANAIRLYQLQSGLKVTGDISPELIDAMKSDAAARGA